MAESSEPSRDISQADEQRYGCNVFGFAVCLSCPGSPTTVWLLPQFSCRLRYCCPALRHSSRLLGQPRRPRQYLASPPYYERAERTPASGDSSTVERRYTLTRLNDLPIISRCLHI